MCIRDRVRVGDEVVVGKANEERTVFGKSSSLEDCPRSVLTCV